MKEFDVKAQEAIGSYVYALFDSGTPLKPFYVGKGKGNRVFSHARGDLQLPPDSEEELSAKIDLIRRIQSEGRTVLHKILRHGMDDNVAHEVEAALIDFVHYTQPGTLTNLVDGHGCERGLCDARDFAFERGAQPLQAEFPVMIIKIERRWTELLAKYGSGSAIPEEDIYEAVRGDWIVKVDRAQQSQCVLAVARGLVRAVIVPTGWQVHDEDKRKKVMSGRQNAEKFSHLIGASVGHLFERGGQNPIRYIG